MTRAQPEPPIADETRATKRARAWAAVAAFLAAALLVARPMHAGAELRELALWASGLAGFVFLPGLALVRWLHREREDRLHEIGLACALGFGLLVAVYALLHALELDHGVLALPVVALVLVARRGRARGTDSATPTSAQLDPRVLAALCVLVVLVALRVPLFSSATFSAPTEIDLWFHAGNVAALGRGLPMEDPRIAGEPFVYHFFSYVPLTLAHQLADIPVEALVQRVAASAFPLLLLLQTFNAARAISGKPWAGVFAAALVILHEDVGAQLTPLAPSFFGAINVHSYLKLGIYHSPTTCLGLAAFATLALLLHRWFERGRVGDLVCAALVGALASGSKGSVMPVVLAGLGVAVAWSFLLRDRPLRAIAALVVLGLVAAPMTLWISSGETGFARAMFGVQPFATARVVGFIQAFSERNGVLDLVRFVPLVPVWLVGFVGLGGWLGTAAAWIRRRALGPAERWLVASALSGIAAACLVAASGESQLFFAYNANVALAMLAGSALASATLPARARNVLLVLGGLPLLAALTMSLARTARDDFRSLPLESVEERDLRAAFLWIREHAPDDAVIVARRRGLHASVIAERTAYYETEAFTANHYGLARKSGLDLARIQLGEGPTHYTERETSLRELFRAPSTENAFAIRHQVDARRPVWFVFDRIEGARRDERAPNAPRDERALPDLDAARFETVFETAHVRVFATKSE